MADRMREVEPSTELSITDFSLESGNRNGFNKGEAHGIKIKHPV